MVKSVSNKSAKRALKSGGKLNKRKRNQIVEENESDEEQTDFCDLEIEEESESQTESDEESERETESSEREIINNKKYGKIKKTINVSDEEGFYADTYVIQIQLLLLKSVFIYVENINKKKYGKRKKKINVSDEEEVSSKSKKSKKESNKARKQKTYKKGSGKQRKKVNLVSGDRPYITAFNGLASLVTAMKKRKVKLTAEQINLLMCFKEAKNDEIKFEFVRDGVKYVLTSTPEEFSVITRMSFFEDRQRETKEAMYAGDFKESEFYIRNFGDRKSATKKEIQKTIFRLLRFQEDKEIDDDLEETDEEEEMEQSPNLSEDDELEEMEHSLSLSEDDEDEEMEKSITRRKNEDLAMLIGLFMCNTLFFTTKDVGAIKEKYLGLVENFENARPCHWRI
ncbi:uncharacterized protein LOC113272665 [Papaver somniferum]|uniref:uncharacterized protein LOC113272665 n=1 Tax=Papaver somniferum TaxID=3469 RepID=UPI000E705193|nr:uncharacterized protein LOC113272665 [Papaver somniferum]